MSDDSLRFNSARIQNSRKLRGVACKSTICTWLIIIEVGCSGAPFTSEVYQGTGGNAQASSTQSARSLNSDPIEATGGSAAVSSAIEQGGSVSATGGAADTGASTASSEIDAGECLCKDSPGCVPRFTGCNTPSMRGVNCKYDTNNCPSATPWLCWQC
jgi:hypothetical protein